MLIFINILMLLGSIIKGQTDIGDFWDDPCDVGNWEYSPSASEDDKTIFFSNSVDPSHGACLILKK